MSLDCKIDKSIVLIAEDDADDRLLLDLAFGPYKDSLRVKFVKDGQELLEYLEACFLEVGLILLDLNMPKVDGRQALVKIKGRADLKDIPIVIWTTSGEEEDRVFCAKAGATDYVTKPSDYLELDTAIKSILESWLCIPPIS